MKPRLITKDADMVSINKMLLQFYSGKREGYLSIEGKQYT